VNHRQLGRIPKAGLPVLDNPIGVDFRDTLSDGDRLYGKGELHKGERKCSVVLFGTEQNELSRLIAE
jgi:hypothetical protein